MKDLIIFGIQGCGKGTQARMLAEKYGMQIFETGAVLRELAKSDAEIAEHQKNGTLVPDALIERVEREFLVRHDGRPTIWDGNGRTIAQKDRFLEILAENGREVVPVLFELSEKVAHERYFSRAHKNEDSGRTDSSESAFLQRTKVFFEQVLPSAESFGERLVRVDASRGVDEIFEDLTMRIDSKN